MSHERKLLKECLDLCWIGDMDETTEAHGWGDTIKRTKALLAQPEEDKQDIHSQFNACMFREGCREAYIERDALRDELEGKEQHTASLAAANARIAELERQRNALRAEVERLRPLATLWERRHENINTAWDDLRKLIKVFGEKEFETDKTSGDIVNRVIAEIERLRNA